MNLRERKLRADSRDSWRDLQDLRMTKLFSASLKDDYESVQKNLDVGGEGYVFDV